LHASYFLVDLLERLGQDAPMKRVLAVAVLSLAACASGGTKPQFGDEDAPNPPPPPIDAQDEFADAPAPDAPSPDAPPPPPPDAAVIPPDMPPDACVPVTTQQLVNPALDLVPDGVGWTQVPLPNLPGGPYPLITADGLAPVSAPNKAWFGGAAGFDCEPPTTSNIVDQLFQDIAIPPGTTEIKITGFFANGTTETGTTVFDTFTLDVIKLDGTPITNVLTMNNTVLVNTFTAFTKTFDATSIAGQTVRLRGTSTNDFLNHSNFFLDSLLFETVVGCP
jgi:hypothetical protein